MRSLLFLMVALATSAMSPRVHADAAALALARRQFCEFYLGTSRAPGGNLTLKSSNEPSPEVARATEFARSLRPDGSWPDLDYASQARSAWPAATHWTRTLAMAAALHAPNAAVDRDALERAVHRAIAYWIPHDFICPNWWYNQIGVPQQEATTALLLGDALKDTERRYLLGTVMPRAKIGMTGQNRVWLAGNTLMFGLIAGDEATVARAADTIWSEVVVTTDEGIQPDFSFHQHGPQQQFGNYGMALAVEICRWATVLRGTPWAMPADRLATYRGFLLDGEAWVVWRRYMDAAACGRQLMPHSQSSKAVTIERVMRNAGQFDPDAAPRYAAFVQRNNDAGAPNDLVGNRVFWRSDYVVHRRPDFAATLKMSSRRVVGAEMVNTENLLGYHEGDGALYLYRRGDEYADIFPVWDWQKLPGTTCAELAGGPPPFEQMRGERDFVGGVTDGANGCSALDFAREGVTAHKAWFFGDDAVVCLGSAIHGKNGVPVVTTLNQSRLRGSVKIKQVGRAPVAFRGDEQRLTDVEWVEHDGWRYAFPKPSTVHLRAAPQTGNWHRVFRNPDTPKADVTLPVFALWLDHRDIGETYAYVVSPSSSSSDTQPAIIADSAAVQAVRLSSDKTAAIFWSPTEQTLTPSLRIAADHPCTVIVDTTARRLFVSDPTQKFTELTLRVNGTPRRIPLPRGGEAGSSVVVTW